MNLAKHGGARDAVGGERPLVEVVCRAIDEREAACAVMRGERMDLARA